MSSNNINPIFFFCNVTNDILIYCIFPFLVKLQEIKTLACVSKKFNSCLKQAEWNFVVDLDKYQPQSGGILRRVKIHRTTIIPLSVRSLIATGSWFDNLIAPNEA